MKSDLALNGANCMWRRSRHLNGRRRFLDLLWRQAAARSSGIDAMTIAQSAVIGLRGVRGSFAEGWRGKDLGPCYDQNAKAFTRGFKLNVVERNSAARPI